MTDETMPDTPNLPDTAPVESQNAYDDHDDNIWGKLFPLGSKLRVTDLTEFMYRVGRSPKCDLYLGPENFDISTYALISKYHFTIIRDQLENNLHIVYLEDLSSNGTYVNGKKVGKGRRVLIKTSDEISLAKAGNKAFIYIDCSMVESWLPETMRSEYEVVKHLGSGGFAEVKLVIEKRTCEQFAMKKVKKVDVEGEKMYNEVRILQRLNHPFIIKLKDILDTPEALFMSLEYISGGDLFKVLQTQKKLKESVCKIIFYQLILALQYLHEQGVTHRDLKPENVLIVNEQSFVNGEPMIKLSDFGLSKLMNSVTELRTTCGTLKYVAPEILAAHGTAKYTSIVDIWSLGVLLFKCLSGDYPFERNNAERALAIQILSGSYQMRAHSWHLVSSMAVNLVKKMLIVCPKQRIPLADIFKHPWLQDYSMVKKIDKLIKDFTVHITNENECLSQEEESPVLKKLKLAN